MLATGTTIAGYRVEGLLGTGGMAVVYEATQLSLGRTVALKVIAPHLSLDPTFRERFRREAMLQAALEHPHIVTVYEAGESDAGLYLAMRLVRGSSLKDIVLGRALDPAWALAILGQTASALDAAHDAGLIHRDVKPHNILVDDDGGAYLADFGLIKSASHRGLTGTGQYLGTLDYVAPEQIRGEPVSALSDLYAFAAVLYECLSGEVPFPRDTEAALLYAHLTEPPPRPSERRAELPDLLDGIVARGMAKRPDARYRSASQLVADARAALALTSVSLPRRTTIPVPADGPVDGDGAERFGSTITDPARLRQAPHLELRSRRRVSPGSIAGLLAAVLVLALAGFALGRAREREDMPTTAVAVGGPIAIAFPSDEWARARERAAVPGLALADPVALASTVPGSRGHLLAGTATPLEGPLLLPQAFLTQLTGTPRSERVRLGAYEALRFLDLRHPRVGGGLTVYVVPTESGGVVVACLAPGAPDVRRAALGRCEAVASTLELRTTRALPVAPDPEYAAHVRHTLELLNGRRTLERRTLGAARTPAAQARAAERLAAGFRAAATSLSERRPRPVERPGHRSLIAALRGAEAAYGRLAAAARAGDGSAYRRAAGAVRRRETAVARAARSLAT